MMPQARQTKLIVQEVGDELVVYDQERHRAHRLNRAAAMVWHHCDGRTSVPDLSARLEGELRLTDNDDTEAVLWLALGQLEKARLLEAPLEGVTDEARRSRREVVQRLGLVAGLTLLLPTVASIVAPTPAMAQYEIS